MILDVIDNLRTYESLNPLFAKVVDFLQQHDLSKMPLGWTEIFGEDVYVNIVDALPKTKVEAKVETHRKMVDIQLPISGVEVHGYASSAVLDDAAYRENDDISFHSREPQTYFEVHPGQFVIYFPSDGHAPAITSSVLRKAIFKVKNQIQNKL